MSALGIGERFSLASVAAGKTLGKLCWWRTVCTMFLLSAAMTVVSSAQSFTTLAEFSGSDGEYPNSSLVQATNGDFYGTTSGGGASGAGAVFISAPAGTLTTLYSFCSETGCTDGEYPEALVQGSDGNFYGTTEAGGRDYFGACSSGCGTLFRVTPSGALTTLYTFCSASSCLDGSYPEAGLVQGSGGNFYGTTSNGGAAGYGTVFKMNPQGLLTAPLYSFCSQSGCSDGAYPGALVQGSDGNFYGTTCCYGAHSGGTVFRITPQGKLTTLYSFCSQSGCTDGGDPYGGLVEGSDGNFYGTTYEGGANTDGTVFRITPQGTLTTLYSFCSQSGCADGSGPEAGVVQGSDGNLYGTTHEGGANGNYGTVFKITPSGSLTTLHSFDGTDGSAPVAALIQGVNGAFYGTTNEDGAVGDGTVFRVSMGLRPFVEALSYRGKVGNTIEFLGQGFTSSTTVSFNGTKASTVRVVSGSYLTATVPSGATTGFVTMTSSGGTLKSNQIFRVIPQIMSFDPASGAEGTVVTINGESFKGATSVTFEGVKASSFKMESYTQITASVPSGAKTGKISVTTPGGTATSAGTFTVPQ
jgi:uncharacterized repeat protein (TIGR03803 family)